MEIIDDRRNLGYVHVAPQMLEQCLAFFNQCNDSEAVAVVLEDGRLLASKAAWRKHFIELQKMSFAARKVCPITSFCEGPAPMIREILTDADGQRRAIEVQAGLQQYGENLAKQTLSDIVIEALEVGATDIHLRMCGHEARISFRIDGLLCWQGNRSRIFVTEVVAAALNTQSDDCSDVFDERRISSASITLALPEPHGEVRIRAQKSPCRDGFTVTLRLQKSAQRELPELGALGFRKETITTLQTLMQQSIGLILISGPTGHGKTTTLAAMNRLVPATRKVISLEDPIEIVQPAIEQKFVPNTAEHNAFSDMLKVVLREDPDVVEVSEIRDVETATSAVSAALTGHLVASTIHANDAMGIIPRLLDIGLSSVQLSQPGLIAGLIAQRLLPRLCEYCKEPDTNVNYGRLWKRNHQGCGECQNRGVLGRIVISEVLIPGIDAGRYIRQQDFYGWREQLQERGWRSLACEAETLVKQGIVSLEDAFEVVPSMRMRGVNVASVEAKDYALNI